MEEQKQIIKETKEILKEFDKDPDNLIQILNEVQEHFGYCPQKAQQTVAEYLNIPLAKVYGVITFYSRFTTTKKGKYNISVCLGTACYVKGSQAIFDRLKERVGIDEGLTTEDGLISIESARCVGACGLAPVFTVNGEVYGRATVKKMDEVLDNILKEKEN